MTRPQGHDGSFDVVAFVELSPATVPTSSAFIGLQPSAVAWDGKDMFVAGRHGTSGFGTVGIARITSVLANPTFSASFGQQQVPATLGYTGLDILKLYGGKIVASLDRGVADPLGISVWLPSGTMAWAVMARGTSGPGFDIPIYGSNVAWTMDDPGQSTILRRALNHHATGAVWYILQNGMGFAFSTRVRDMDHAPSGDLWFRTDNLVMLLERKQINVGLPLIVKRKNPVPHMFGTNIAFIDIPGDDLVVYNDRQSYAPTQEFAKVVKVIRVDGKLADVEFPGFAPLPGNGYYDFSWDSDSRTLAILDQVQQAVYVFKHYEEAALFCTAKAGLICGVPFIRQDGVSSASATSGFVIESRPALGDRLGVLIYSTALGSPVPFHGGTLCLGPTDLHRAGPTSSLGTAGDCNGVFFIDMNAFAQGQWKVPGASTLPTFTPQPFLLSVGQTVHCQFWARDTVASGSFVSGGLTYTIGP
jgi:hypothetical protein